MPPTAPPGPPTSPLARARWWAGGLLPGAQERRAHAAAYAAEWDEELAGLDHAADGPLWAVLGDSTAQAVGASSRRGGYVLATLDRLRAERDPRFEVANLSVTGARVRDVLDVQLPRLAALRPPALVTCAIGANDLLRTPADQLVADLRRLVAALPEGALVANLPQGLRRPKALRANAAVEGAAAARGLAVVDLWSVTGPPWKGRFARDGFHPNDLGYEAWTGAFCAALGLPGDRP